MQCKNCGVDIEEGRELCIKCEMEKEEADVVVVSKADIILKDKHYQEKPFEYSGFVSGLLHDVFKIIAVLSAIATYASTFLPWMVLEANGSTTKATLFDICGKKSDAALNDKVILAMLVVILASSLVMLLFTGVEHIKIIKKYEDIFAVKLIAPFVALCAYFILINYNKLKDAWALANSSKGIGATICLVGICVYIVTVIIGAIKKGDKDGAGK